VQDVTIPHLSMMAGRARERPGDAEHEPGE
jgi:hypothetical protein